MRAVTTAQRVLSYLHRVGGDIDTHGADSTKIWLNSYAPARNALVKRGLVTNSGLTRINERGNQAIVWVATPAGVAALREGL